LETFLRCFVSSCPRKWIKYVTLAEFWYNTSHHSSINMSPFEVLYGHPPRHFSLSVDSVSASTEVDAVLGELAMMLSSVRQHLLRA